MATSFPFGGQNNKIPNSYADIKSGVKNPPVQLPYGNVLILDSGSGAGYGGGAGVGGTLQSGKDAIYEFDNIDDYRDFQKGGLHWLLAEPLFRPAGPGIPGISKAFCMKAANTTPAEIALTFSGNGSGATATATASGLGVITSITLTAGGTGYGEAPVISFSGTPSSQAVVTVTVVDGVITALTLVSGGLGYDVSPTVSITNVTNGITMTLQVTDEGLIGNGVLAYLDEDDSSSTSNLSKGFGCRLVQGLADTSKFSMVFYRGTYKGLDQNGLPYDGISAYNSIPLVLAKSPEFNTYAQLTAWMATDYYFLKAFKLKTSAAVGNGFISSTSLATLNDYQLAAGGTESYADTTLIDRILEAVQNLNISFIFSDNYGSDAQSAYNYKLLTHVLEKSKFKPEIYIGGGDTINDWVSKSIAAAKYYDKDCVSIVHGAIYKNSQQGKRTYNVLYKTAALLGREAGLAPQVPLTFKNINIDGEVDSLPDKRVEQGLDAGVLMTRFENGSFDCIKGINSLQMNTFLLNENSTTSSKQIKRIGRQLNMEIIVNSKQQLLKDPLGPNSNTLSDDDLVNWTKGYLGLKKAIPSRDNLILSFGNVTVTRNQDARFIGYEFRPNSEVSFLFFTGTIVDL